MGCAVALLGTALAAGARRSDGGMDNAFVVKAARAVLAGESPYADERFLYLPSAVLAAVPEALLPWPVLRWAVPLVSSGLVLAGWWGALRLFGVPPGSRFAVAGAGLGALVFRPYANLVQLGNWTCVAVAALPVVLLLARRGRWAAAGAVAGLAVACKPMLVPLAVLFLLARARRGLALLVAVPAGASLLGALLMPEPELFLTRTLPFLLRGQDAFALVWDASPVAVLPRLGVPVPVAVSVAGALAGAGLWCARRRWRRPAGPGESEELRLAETAAAVMLSAFLVSRPSFDHYLLVVLPLLLASGVRAGSVPRSGWFWAGLLPQAAGVPWPVVDTAHRRAFRDCATLVVLAVVVMRECAGRGRVSLVYRRTAGAASAVGPADAGTRTAF
ncbi:glycosyltransferase family 87 protein [Streptomyces sp. NPDC097619]|uniref:glycosyltransferase family 87 protein n=1 Tax=Streptomyces sp. NPDC097619 TaxID=3157228 RepID=UPI0033189683